MKLLSTPIRWQVYERANPANSTCVSALSESLAQRAGGIVLGVSADKVCAHPLLAAQSQREQLSSLRSSF